MVLAAIEGAIDIDGLHAWDRGRLAELHATAGWHVGLATPTVPIAGAPHADLTRLARRAALTSSADSASTRTRWRC
jgi:hypothetical protein